MVCRPSCGPCVGDVPRFACGRAGVEEIMGFAGSLGGLRGVVWVCFWVPGPPPASVLGACGFPDAPGGTPWACGPRAGSGRGAWWFENWIVDASNAMNSVSSFALSRFRQASFLESGFEIDRFVIIFYSVMICRLAFEAIIRVFRGVCRPEGRMVDALADSTDEGRLRMR